MALTYKIASLDKDSPATKDENITKSEHYTNKAVNNLLEEAKDSVNTIKDITHVVLDAGKLMYEGGKLICVTATAGYAILPEKETISDTYYKYFGYDETSFDSHSCTSLVGVNIAGGIFDNYKDFITKA